MAAERDTIDRLIATFLADQIGAEFEGRIGGVTKAGLFVRLTETGADGFVPASRIGDEYFRFDETARALVGTRTGSTYQLGAPVVVRLVEAAPFAGALRFDLVSEGRRRKALGKSAHPSGRKGGLPAGISRSARKKGGAKSPRRTSR